MVVRTSVEHDGKCRKPRRKPDAGAWIPVHRAPPALAALWAMRVAWAAPEAWVRAWHSGVEAVEPGFRAFVAWVVKTYEPDELDAIFRLHGRQDFAKVLLELYEESRSDGSVD